MAEPAPMTPDPSARLVAVYERIHATRMAGLAFLNPALRVEAVGFHPWNGQWLGVLVTPWSMNLVLMPGGGPWMALAAGGERIVEFPAGRFRFIAGSDEPIGEHHACSLFSPTLGLADAEAARATALECLRALFEPAMDDGGEDPARPAAVRRRDFLAGQFSGGRDADRR